MTVPPSPAKGRFSWSLCGSAAALAAALAVLALQQAQPGQGLTALPLRDFVEYWAAGRLNAQGDNPYDPEAMERLERRAGHQDEVILMWNPPWTLPLVMPFGLLDVRTAHLLWLLLHLSVLAGCADALWRFYGGPDGLRWLGWVLALTFLPTSFALLAGQISPLLLLGATGFLVLVRRGRDLPAGACVALLALKPHLAYLFWVALLLWSVRTRRWRVLAGGALAGLAATAVALARNPAVLGQYWHTFTHRPPAQYRSPTLGTLLRLALGGAGGFAWQYAALLPGLAWFAFSWRRQRRNWVWEDQLPLLLLVSVLTAAYGAWPFDLVFLLPPVLQTAAALARDGRLSARTLGVVAFLAFDGVGLALLAREVEYLAFIWMTPALLLAYLALRPPAPGVWASYSLVGNWTSVH